jgi:hypothetical protein
MARTNRVIVSPGVYTSEKDLTYVAQSVGITTLGLVGETLKGPAFEPVLIGSFDEYRTYFGGTSTEKFANGNPKYELPFFAKSYLQQSSQLFVTRILGLTGYKPNNSWVITTSSTATTYNNVAVAMIRSRGSYSGNTLNYSVSAASGVTLSNTTAVSTNPLADFTLTAGGKSFTISLDKTSKTFITKVLGSDIFDKDSSEFPVFVSEEYSNWLAEAWKQGNVTGLNVSLGSADEGTNYVAEWSTARSPWIVSEVRGGKVADLFRFITVSDGNSSNKEVKVSIANISLDNLEFDVIVRDFNDTDDSPIVLEKYARCSMNPTLPGYIGKKIGSSDGDYELKSRFIMIELQQDHPTDAVPAGFKGYPAKSVSGKTVGAVVYKKKYDKAGDIIAVNPTSVISNGDKIRKTYLGFSSAKAADDSLLDYKGEVLSGVTKGYHLSSQAAAITDSTTGAIVFDTNTINFETSEGDYANLNAAKFTVAMFGGFDGWDIYRSERTNTNSYIVGKSTYTGGNTDNGGVFNPTNGNSDYYAYLQGITVYNNPEAVNINVLSTPGINFYDHSSLVQEAIDIVEIDRADCLYIVNAPNDTMENVIDYLDEVGIDSSYTATYHPWIQVRDTDNGTQLYIPPTGEVLKNIAYTDNVAHPWFAPAGVTRGKVNSIKAKEKLTLDQRDDLYKSRINPIATFANEGTLIWGNKTLQVKESPLDRLNVRRLLIQARKLIAAVSLRLLFEQNDDVVRNEFERLVNPILASIQNERGLTDFRVVVSYAPEDIEKNTLKGRIFIKPTKSLEYIEVEFVVTPTGASFENV